MKPIKYTKVYYELAIAKIESVLLSLIYDVIQDDCKKKIIWYFKILICIVITSWSHNAILCYFIIICCIFIYINSNNSKNASKVSMIPLNHYITDKVMIMGMILRKVKLENVSAAGQYVPSN